MTADQIQAILLSRPTYTMTVRGYRVMTTDGAAALLAAMGTPTPEGDEHLHAFCTHKVERARKLKAALTKGPEPQ